MESSQDEAARRMIENSKLLKELIKVPKRTLQQDSLLKKKLIEVVEQVYESIESDEDEIALDMLQKVETCDQQLCILEKFNDFILPFCIYYNHSSILQKHWGIDDLPFYLETSINLLILYFGFGNNIHDLSIPEDQHSISIYEESNSSETKSLRVKMLLELAKCCIQACAIHSQRSQNEKALKLAILGKHFLKILVHNLLCLIEEFASKSKAIELGLIGEEENSNNPYFHPLMKIPELKRFQNFTSSDLLHDFKIFSEELLAKDPTLKENQDKNFYSDPDQESGIIFWKHNSQNNEKYFKTELMKRASDLGVKKKLTTMWLSSYSIGNVMQIKPVRYSALVEPIDFHDYFGVNLVVEIMLTYSCNLFTIATEHRFICQEQLRQERCFGDNADDEVDYEVKKAKNVARLKQNPNFVRSEKYHLTSIHLLCTFLEDCPLFNHLMNSYHTNYYPNLYPITEVSEYSMLSESRLTIDTMHVGSVSNSEYGRLLDSAQKYLDCKTHTTDNNFLTTLEQKSRKNSFYQDKEEDTEKDDVDIFDKDNTLMKRSTNLCTQSPLSEKQAPLNESLGFKTKLDLDRKSETIFGVIRKPINKDKIHSIDAQLQSPTKLFEVPQEHLQKSPVVRALEKAHQNLSRQTSKTRKRKKSSSTSRRKGTSKTGKSKTSLGGGTSGVATSGNLSYLKKSGSSYEIGHDPIFEKLVRNTLEKFKRKGKIGVAKGDSQTKYKGKRTYEILKSSSRMKNKVSQRTKPKRTRSRVMSLIRSTFGDSRSRKNSRERNLSNSSKGSNQSKSKKISSSKRIDSLNAFHFRAISQKRLGFSARKRKRLKNSRSTSRKTKTKTRTKSASQRIKERIISSKKQVTRKKSRISQSRSFKKHSKTFVMDSLQISSSKTRCGPNFKSEVSQINAGNQDRVFQDEIDGGQNNRQFKDFLNKMYKGEDKIAIDNINSQIGGFKQSLLDHQQHTLFGDDDNHDIISRSRSKKRKKSRERDILRNDTQHHKKMEGQHLETEYNKTKKHTVMHRKTSHNQTSSKQSIQTSKNGSQTARTGNYNNMCSNLFRSKGSREVNKPKGLSGTHSSIQNQMKRKYKVQTRGIDLDKVKQSKKCLKPSVVSTRHYKGGIKSSIKVSSNRNVSRSPKNKRKRSINTNVKKVSSTRSKRLYSNSYLANHFQQKSYMARINPPRQSGLEVDKG